MIQTKQDLEHYLAADKYALGIKRIYPKIFGDNIWKYQIALRKYEYYLNISKQKAYILLSLYI